MSYILKVYHADVSETLLKEIIEMMIIKLSDNASPVRESAAMSLVDLAPLLSLQGQLKTYISTHLLRAKD